MNFKIQSLDKSNAGSLKGRILTVLSLFSSSGTLICCALPALFVTLGFGSAFAGLISNFPWLVGLSHHKSWVFAISGMLLALTTLMLYSQRRDARVHCDTNAGNCESVGKFTWIALWISAAIYLFGFFMAYLYLPILLFLEAR